MATLQERADANRAALIQRSPQVAVAADGTKLYQSRNQRSGGSTYAIVLQDGSHRSWDKVGPGGRVGPKPPPNGGNWRWDARYR